MGGRCTLPQEVMSWLNAPSMLFSLHVQLRGRLCRIELNSHSRARDNPLPPSWFLQILEKLVLSPCILFRHVCLCVCVCVCVCSTAFNLCNPMDCSPPGFCVPGIFPARILEWGAVSSSMGSSQPKDRTCKSGAPCTGRQILYLGATWKPAFIVSQFSSTY